MMFNVFKFEGFQPQKPTMKFFYLLILLGYFNTFFEDDKVLYPDGTCDWLTKDDFHSAQFMQMNF